MHSRSSFTAAKKLLSAYAQQSKPRSIRDAFTPSSSLEEVSFGLSRRNSLEEVSFGLSRSHSNAVDGASPMLISSTGHSNNALDKATPGIKARIDVQG